MFNLIKCILISSLFSSSALGASDFYQNSMNTIDGKAVKFSKYKGKTLLVVNTASGCGYTPQLKDMQELAKKYDSSKFEVLGFPSNSFNQESLKGEKIKKFCFLNYGAKFTLFEKSEVKGKKINPVFDYLVKKSSSPKDPVSWNFEKFVVSPQGKIIGRFKSSIKPTDKKITALIEKSLK